VRGVTSFFLKFEKTVSKRIKGQVKEGTEQGSGGVERKGRSSTMEELHLTCEAESEALEWVEAICDNICRRKLIQRDESSLDDDVGGVKEEEKGNGGSESYVEVKINQGRLTLTLTLTLIVGQS